MNTKWNYLLVSVSDEGPWVEESLWTHGAEGWELVSAYTKDGSVKLYFKKPLENSADFSLLNALCDAVAPVRHKA